MKFTLDKDVQFILNKLNENGVGFLVGGAIRDMILGNDPGDFDFATDIDYEKLKYIFKDYSPNEIGVNFGILSIIINGKSYEIAKFRKETGIFNSRYPKKIKFVGNIKEDLKRRDFTINSLAYNEKDGIINLYDGINHIEKKLIKFVGNPKLRIEEDALRILRAFRFIAKLGFSLDKKTADSIYEKRKFLSKISKERIFDELRIILTAEYSKKAIKEMKKLGVLEIIIPEYKYLRDVNRIEKKDVFKKILRLIDKSEKDLIIKLSILFYEIGKVNSETIDSKGNISFDGYERESSSISEERLKGLKVSNKIINDVKKIVLYHTLPEKKYQDKVLKKIILDLEYETFSKLLSFLRSVASISNNFEKNRIEKFLDRVNGILSKGKIPMLKDIAITGVDLINLKFDIKDINNIKEEIHDLVLDETLENDKEKIVKYLVDKYNIDFSFNNEISCGAVIYNKDMKKYLIVKTKNGNWGFAKGHMEIGESERETAIREVKEETNIDIEIDKNIREVLKYVPKENIFKKVVLFLGICSGEIDVRIEEEEIEEYMWCSFEEAIKNITYKVQRDVLEKINGYIKNGI